MTPFTRALRTIRNLMAAAAVAVVAANVLAGLSGLGGAAGAATPTLPVGKKTITLVSAGGERLVIGTVTLTATGAPDAPQRTIDVKLDSPDFGDQFLSMRPFPLPSRSQGDVVPFGLHLRIEERNRTSGPDRSRIPAVVHLPLT